VANGPNIFQMLLVLFILLNCVLFLQYQAVILTVKDVSDHLTYFVASGTLKP